MSFTSARFICMLTSIQLISYPDNEAPTDKDLNLFNSYLQAARVCLHSQILCHKVLSSILCTLEY